MIDPAPMMVPAASTLPGPAVTMPLTPTGTSKGSGVSAGKRKPTGSTDVLRKRAVCPVSMVMAARRVTRTGSGVLAGISKPAGRMVPGRRVVFVAVVTTSTGSVSDSVSTVPAARRAQTLRSP
nr:hypothetical protein [Pandoravirus belohorizontensis]